MREEMMQLTAADFEEAMAFLNEVFGEHSPHDFAALLPSIYQPTDEQMSCNHAVRVNGQIRAVVGLFPIDWHVGDTVLRVGGIGGVSTHRSVRGAGYMKRLMTHCVQLMRDQGTHLSWLGGQRQRYGYFGFEKCGVHTSLSLSAANVRHGMEPVALRFEPLQAGDEAALDLAHRLHSAQSVHCRRRRTFFHRFLVSWYHRPHLARNADGDAVGYLVSDAEGKHVTELLAVDEGTALAMAGEWVRQRNEDARFDMAPASTGLLRGLGALAESYQLSASGNWQIFDWAATVAAVLQVRARQTDLPDGAVALGIEGYGTLEIEVAGTQVECRRSGTHAAVTWDPFTAMRVFFGPLVPEAVVDLPAALVSLHSWCPLPLAWPKQDGV